MTRLDIRKVWLFVIAACFLMLTPVHAADFHVDNTQALKIALSLASSNFESDTIYPDKGIYSGGFEYLAGKDENSDLTVKCENGLGAADVVLDGGTTEQVLVLVDVYHPANFSVQGITVQNGDGWFSGGLEISTGGNIQVAECVIQDNVGTRGGGIFASTAAEILIKDNVIMENSAKNGGGIYPQGGKVTITGNSIVGNVADGDGGGVRVSGYDMTLEKNNIYENTAYRGGGIYAFQAGDAILNVSANTISENSGGYGGGVNVNVHTSIFVNNVIAKNTASLDGGGFSAYTNSGSITLTNNTIADNAADDDAGGIDVTTATDAASLYVYNNIIRSNTAAEFSEDIQLLGQGVKYGFNNDYQTLIGSWSDSADNIDSDPLFVNTISSDYKLSSSSPCIDVGDNDAPSIPFTDRADNIRIYDGTGDGNAVVDMGAYEYIPGSSIRNEVVPNITANGENGSITISEGEALTVAISLDPGDREGEDADWWVVAWTPFGWASYGHSGTAWYWSMDLAMTWEGELFSLGELEVVKQLTFPGGEYFFLFGLDMDGDGIMDYSDTVAVNIR